MTTIGITMGCPAGIGPEIILKYFALPRRQPGVQAVVLGDRTVLEKSAANLTSLGLAVPEIRQWLPGDKVPENGLPLLPLSALTDEQIHWGRPNISTAKAMAGYIEAAVELATGGAIDGIATCPISKIALKNGGYNFPGHTEMLGSLTNTPDFAMMMAGSRLRVTLVTIHCAISEVPAKINHQGVLKLIETTHRALLEDFGLHNPRIAVAALNPHGGEGEMFGTTESTTIEPAIEQAREEGISVTGPYPPDTIFYQAANGAYDAVVCMYHDQGLIPFKLLHFEDGVNVTLGLPVVRTSVDHGTAYDIAGKGKASSLSLREAVTLAASISENRKILRLRQALP
jgi:4-hydroxythreonine-4-phosphate dehydrogenase